MSVFMSIRRMKEFGIRKVLGATPGQIAILHLGHFFKLAAMASLLALPLSYMLMKEWLNVFAYRVEQGAGTFVTVLVISLVLIIFSAGYAAVRAGCLNPLKVIKMD
jgi:putative ABC transport system permease protein